MSQSSSRAGVSTGKVALAVVLLSESVFFGTLLAAYAGLRSESSWHPAGGAGALILPAANTLIFLLSVIPAYLAARRPTRANSVDLWLASTFALGLIFVAGQLYEFGRSGMRVDDAAFGGVFFALMGFHALHVVAGLVFLGINLVRSRLGDFASQNSDAVEVGSLFWYYVVAVWLVLFTVLYLI